MDRQEAIRMANHIAEATPSTIWLVLYWPVTNCHELIPQHALSADAVTAGAQIVHVAHRAAELQPV